MDIQSFIETLSPTGILMMLALLACAESLAVVGIIVPGVALLTLVSALAAQQDIALIWVLSFGFAGAVIGDAISFWIGFVYKDSVHLWPGFRSHPQWLQQSTRFIERYGSYSVVLGRFVGPIRPFIPVAAGLFRMSPRLFFTLNLCSAALWAPLYLLPGYLTGAWLDFSQPWVWGGIFLASILAIGVTVLIQKQR
jgi:membrane protein DedA with SNARE-associated domain